MRNLSYLDKYRVDVFGDGYLGDIHNGAFKIKVKGEEYFIIASDGMGWEHISVSTTKTKKNPSWNVMCKIKDMFFEDEEVVVQYHPKKSDYINNHNFCLHLWKPIYIEIPTPPSILVGVKEINKI